MQNSKLIKTKKELKEIILSPAGSHQQLPVKNPAENSAECSGHQHDFRNTILWSASRNIQCYKCLIVYLPH